MVHSFAACDATSDQCVVFAGSRYGDDLGVGVVRAERFSTVCLLPVLTWSGLFLRRQDAGSIGIGCMESGERGKGRNRALIGAGNRFSVDSTTVDPVPLNLVF